MATVNIANNTWLKERDTDTIDIGAYSSLVYFAMGAAKTDEMAFAKACVAIDADTCDTITFTYSEKTKSGLISSLWFGIFDDMSLPANLNNINSDEIIIDSGDWKDSGDSITIDISSLTGTKYVGFLFYGNTYTIDGSLILQEVEISSLTATVSGYTLTYDANGGSGAPDSVSNITSTTISSTVPIRSGYDFLGWSTSSSATSASYVAGNSISLNFNVTLYAVWARVYTITFDANGGYDAPSPETKTHNVSFEFNDTHMALRLGTYVACVVTFDSNGGGCDIDELTIDHDFYYFFSHWNTVSDGSGISYYIGDSYKDNSDVTLYAQYEPFIAYNSITLPTPYKANCDFLGWSTNEFDTSGIIGEYTPTEDITLYAIWKLLGNAYIYDGVDGFNPYQVLIYDGSGWNQYIPYIYTESGWELYSG